MTKSELMDVINSELAAIEESKSRIKKHAAKLNEINPLSLGQELVVNGYSHSGKTIVVDKVFVSDRQGKDVTVTANMPVNFTATGLTTFQSTYLAMNTQMTSPWLLKITRAFEFTLVLWNVTRYLST